MSSVWLALISSRSLCVRGAEASMQKSEETRCSMRYWFWLSESFHSGVPSDTSSPA